MNDQILKELDEEPGIKQVLVHLLQHKEEFLQFWRAWQVHSKREEESMLQVNSLHGSFGGIQPHIATMSANSTSMAEILRQMKDGLISQNTGLINQNDRLITPAISDKRVPMWAFVSVVVILSLIIALFLLRDSDKNFIAGKDGIRIESSNVEESQKKP